MTTGPAKTPVSFGQERTFAEFFAGIGLVHLGLCDSGWSCVYANDFDPKKKQMYLAAFPKADYYDEENILNVEQVASKLVERPVLATASFPCIDLSLAGHYRGIDGPHSSTFFAFAKVLELLKRKRRSPPLVMIENVRGFLTSHNGDDFAKACTTLAELGYYLDTLVIDAKHFTPQSRQRVFIIGAVKKAIPDSAILQDTSPALADPWYRGVLERQDIRPRVVSNAISRIKLRTGWVAFDLPHLPPVNKNLSAVIDIDEAQEWWDKAAVDRHLDMMSDIHKKHLERLLATPCVTVGTIFRRKRYGKMRAEIRFDGLSGCLRTAKGGSARQIVIVLNNGSVRMRWMSPREYARLQGANDFPVTVGTNQALHGFGDAVCVPVIKWLDRHVLSKLAECVAGTV